MVAVYGFHREGWKANCNVLGATVFRRRVLHPLSSMRDDGLPGSHVESSGLVRNPQQSCEHHGEFVELRRLPGLKPSFGTPHVRDTGGGGSGIHAPDVFVNELGLVAGGSDASGLGD